MGPAVRRGTPEAGRKRGRKGAARRGDRRSGRFAEWRYYGFSNHAAEADASAAEPSRDVVASSPAVGSVVTILPDDCVTTVVNGSRLSPMRERVVSTPIHRLQCHLCGRPCSVGIPVPVWTAGVRVACWPKVQCRGGHVADFVYPSRTRGLADRPRSRAGRHAAAGGWHSPGSREMRTLPVTDALYCRSPRSRYLASPRRSRQRIVKMVWCSRSASAMVVAALPRHSARRRRADATNPS